MSDPVEIRRATVNDAASIVAIWQAIVAERGYSAIDRPFTLEQERAYIQSLSDREAIFLAAVGKKVIGFQSLDLYARYTASMDHVAQLGTFVVRDQRGKGIGHRLAQHTFTFARSTGYQKVVILVRAKNTAAQGFYASLGFQLCGRLSRQTKIAGEYDDEILMELFL